VLKILSSDKNLQQWIDEEIDRLQSELDSPYRRQRLQQLQEDLRRIDELNPPNRETLERKATQQIAQLEGELNYYALWIYRYQLLKAKLIRLLPEDRFATFLWIMAAVIIGVTLKGVFEFLHEWLIGYVTNRTLFDLRNDLFRQSLRQDVRQLASQGTSDLMARFTNDMEQLGTGLKVLLGKMVGEPLKALSCLIVAALISWQLTLVFAIMVPGTIVVLVRVSRLMRRAARKVLERMSAMYDRIQETFQAVRVVKAFTREAYERRRFHGVNQAYLHKSMRLIAIDAATGPFVEVLTVSAIGLALACGTYLVVSGQTHIWGMRMTSEPLGFPALLQLYALLVATAEPVRRLSSVYTKLQAGEAAAARIFELYDRKPQVTINPQGPRLREPLRTIEFRNVCFTYTTPENPALYNINLTVRAGEVIAIVGANGSGKSTLLGLIPRFFDPDSGAVLIDGVCLRTMHLRSLRRLVGLVTQDTLLFDDTVYANIAYGRRGATPEEVVAAAQKARAHDFIIKKPQGYDTRMGDAGANFSGGEKQKIALARALIRDPAILMLDEFTSAVDPQSEADIHAALRDFAIGRTVFLITHKLHTLQIADRIVVMDGGRIIDVGTHTELSHRCPLYQRLCDSGSPRMAA
jgi:ATP-binding cassette subfamily B protein/subfamily B ATP-binding cassette protein MsbA